MGVLAQFSTSEQALIYKDNQFGMDSVRKLLTWVIAAGGPSEEEQKAAQQLLVDHFKGVGMTNERLQVIVGQGSMLAMIITVIK